MIRWMLRELERLPTALFSERELTDRFPGEFEACRREKLIHRVALPPATTSCTGADGHHRVVISEGAGFLSSDEDDPEAEPEEAPLADLVRWRLDLGAMARVFQKANGLSGTEGTLDSRLFFLGQATRDGLSVAFVLGLLCERKIAMVHLRALPNLLPHRYDRLVVVCPTLLLTPTEHRELDLLSVFVTPLGTDETFVVDYTQALERPARKGPRVLLSDEEEREFASRGFRSRLPILITGRSEWRRKNLLEVAGHDVVLTDFPFRLFLRLVVALFETDDGFLSRVDLTDGTDPDSEQALAPEGLDQALSRLRGPFRAALGDLKPTQLIEVRGGRVRLSTHRRYVTWDLDALMLHADGLIQKMSRRLARRE